MEKKKMCDKVEAFSVESKGMRLFFGSELEKKNYKRSNAFFVLCRCVWRQLAGDVVGVRCIVFRIILFGGVSGQRPD